MTIAEARHSHIVEPHAARESPVIKPLFDRKDIRAGQYEARSGMEPLEKPPNYYNNYSSYTSFAERDDVGTFKRNKSSFHAVTTNYHEQSSLFSKTDAGRVADINAARLRADKVMGFPKPLVESETAFMWSLSAQLLLSNVIDFMPGFISGVLTGHLSTAYSSELIAAKSISNIFMMITGYTINIAVGAAMDTLCAQAYGAGKLHEMGLFFQTGLLLFMICFIPVLIITYFCVDILVLLGQNPDIALLARNLVWYSIPSLPFSMVNALLCKILQGQNMIKPMVYAGLVGNIVHGIVIYSLMFHTSMGYLGSSIASSALIMCYTLTLCTYFYQSHLYQREWPGWKLHDAMKLVPEFIKLGVSGLGMIMFESWAFSAVTLFAGALPVGDVAVSADSTYSSFRVMCALFYGTVAMVGSVRVGNALGANDPQRAKFAAYFSIGLCVVVALLSSFVMLMLRNTYPYAYTNDERVVSLTSTLMLLTCPFQVFAGISAVGQGIMRGSGMQGLGARVNFIAYMVCAIPIGLTFAYQFEMGLIGLWLGLCSGFVCSGMYCLYWLLHANWTELAIDAQKRTREPCERSPETNSSSTFV